MSKSWEIEECFEVFARENLSLAKQTLKELVLIPAATGREEKRAEYCIDWMRRQGITDVFSDEIGNVIWEYQSECRRKVLFTAHLDTVFSEDEPLKLAEEDGIWKCPGIGDNTVNVVLLLMAAKYLQEVRPKLPCGLILSADVGEEGLGNLKGIRGLTDTYEKQLSEVIAFDLYRDKIYPRCIGSVRYRIGTKTEGGHSFLDFGRKNAIAELCSLVTELYQMCPKAGSRTTYNVGVVEGGTSVNTIAQEASMLFEFRSDSYEELDACEKLLENLIEKRRCSDVLYTCEMVGKRPCARETDKIRMARITNCCVKTLQAAVGTAPVCSEASTDCNIPLSRHIPSVCVGFCRGGGAHTREEWLDISTLETGLISVLALVYRIPFLCGDSEIVLRNKITDMEEKEQIRSLLMTCDKDFIPPLSVRNSTSQIDWSQIGGKGDGIEEYLENISQQHVILWKENGVIRAFITWKDHFRGEYLPEYPDSCYLTTLCIDPAYRGQGISERLYELAETEIRVKFPDSAITLRTWSGNRAQEHILHKIGYHVVRVLENDRGEGIDTVYYAKSDIAKNIGNDKKRVKEEN